MYLLGQRLVVSPSDLTGYLECQHLTQQELAAVRGDVVRPKRSDPLLDLIAGRGLKHESLYLNQLRSLGRTICEINPTEETLNDLHEAEARTVQAMNKGAEVIYQATFFDGRWRCHADFLIRVETPSRLGDFSYEVADAKLATRAKASAVLQLCAYSEQVSRVQGVDPEHIRIILGNMSEETLRLKDYSAYFRSIKARFESTVFGAPEPTYPDPVEHCEVCRWAEVCEERRRRDDHLCLVAGMARTQTGKLTEAGIPTVTALASAPEGRRIVGMGSVAYERLRHQAQLQLRQNQTGRVSYELIAPSVERVGLSALPPPSPGDLFFDMEGDPFAAGGNLDYLFGLVETADGQPQYRALWARDRVEEKRAFEDFIDLVIDRLDTDPSMHIYHYAAYERTALKRLMGTYATRENEVDRLLRGGVLIDLYQIVRQSVRISQESYSLKKLEVLYREQSRTAKVADAAESMVAYASWLESNDDSILEAIASYNRDDCFSIRQLRDWLEARRIEAASRFGLVPRPPVLQLEANPQLAVAEAEASAVAEKLLRAVPEETGQRDREQQARWLLAHLLGWHRREAKSEWWEYYRRLGLTDEELREDGDAIAGLTYEGPTRQVKQSLVHRYRFEPQENKIGPGTRPVDPRTEGDVGVVETIDNAEGVLELKRGIRMAAAQPNCVVPGKPIATDELRMALMRVGEWVVAHGLQEAGPYRAARDLICLSPPRLRGHETGTSLQRRAESASAAARRCALALERSYLAIQGPPGSGKTWTAARMVVDLVSAGKRVGITATSHKVIGNLLDEVCKYAKEAHVTIRPLQKADEQQRSSASIVESTESNSEVQQKLDASQVDIVAGTPFLFAREQLADRLDTLFVDEAGQMSLANVVAISGSAQNLVLLGDPNQLAQPTHGIHPPGADRSVLEHLIEKSITLPPERGIFLDTTYRMHPDLCSFVSEIFYGGRLEPDSTTSRQGLAPGNTSWGTGLRYLPVPHQGNGTSSPEEAAEAAAVLGQLLGLFWTDKQQTTRLLDISDVLFVAPYNAQVRQLVENLPPGSKIGTVDKFQGQQAPVLIYSMAASTVDELPRGMEFLFSLNRLNVAISRAQGMAVALCSPELLRVRARTPHQMRLANALCRLVEVARKKEVRIGT